MQGHLNFKGMKFKFLEFYIITILFVNLVEILFILCIVQLTLNNIFTNTCPFMSSIYRQEKMDIFEAYSDFNTTTQRKTNKDWYTI